MSGILSAIGQLLTRNPFNTGTKVGITTKPLPQPPVNPMTAMGPVLGRPSSSSTVGAPVPPVTPTAPAPSAGPSLQDALMSIAAGQVPADTAGVASGGPSVAVPQSPAPLGNDMLAQLLGTLPPAPNHDAYLAPYAAATKQANDTFASAQPVINGAYDQLRQQLAQTAASGAADNAKRASDAASQQAALRDQLAQLTGNVGADLAKQGVIPSLAGNVGAVANAQQANLGLQAGQQAGLFNDMAARAAVDNQARVQNADGGQAAALANSKNNLDALLGQIGLKQAGAEQQYQSDLSNRAHQEAALRLQFAQAQQGAAAQNAKDQFQMQLQQATQDHSDAQTALKLRQAQAQASLKALVSPRDQFDASMPDRAQQFPKATKLFNDLVAKGGNTASGANLAKALTYLGQLTPQFVQKNYGFTPDAGTMSTVESWLRSHYDNNKTVVDPDKLRQALSEINFAQ